MLTSDTFDAAMQRACLEARKALGATPPNPPVGAAALDETGEILAVAAHRKAGEDHAEAALLKLCRSQGLLSRVKAITVTLEPCNHAGRTPPCCDAIIESGIRTVCIGTRDPNTNVRGGGVERLRAAGVEVIEGVKEEMCSRLIHAFALHTKTGKPFVTVKRAFDSNGSMIPPPGEKTFTSEKALVLAHKLRKKADAIVTGSGTILADSPLFTVRHVEDYAGKNRLLAVLDRRGRVPHTYIEESAKRGLAPAVYKGVFDCFRNLTSLGVQDVLVEAGPKLSQSILNSPYWTMCVDIRKGETETVEVIFNSNIELPFDVRNFKLEDILPI